MKKIISKEIWKLRRDIIRIVGIYQSNEHLLSKSREIDAETCELCEEIDELHKSFKTSLIKLRNSLMNKYIDCPQKILKLTAEEGQQVLELKKLGLPITHIARKFNVHPSTIKNHVKRHSS